MELRGVLSVIILNFVIPARGKHGKEEKQCPELVQETGYYTAVFEGTCYMFVDQEQFWKEASTHCLQMGGDLVAIKNANVMKFLKKHLNSNELKWENQGVWIGARHFEDKGWQWTTGEKLKYTYWASGEPSKTLGLFSLENCALMRRNDGWRWHDYHCGALKFHYNYICQFPTIPVTTPTTEAAPTAQGEVIIVKQVDLRLSGHPGLEAIAHSYLERGHSAHSSSSGQHKDNGNMSILLIVIGLAGLVIFGMLVIFFIYRKKQKDKSREETIVRFENRSYGPVSQSDHYALPRNDSHNQRPVSNVYMSPEEVSALYEEVNKQVSHGVNTYQKDTNCLAAQAPPPPPPPRSDSASGASSLCEGAVGGQETSSGYEEPVKTPLIGATPLTTEEESELKGGNLYVDMKGGSKSSDLDVEMGDKKKETEPVYTNTVELKPGTENLYEDFPGRK